MLSRANEEVANKLREEKEKYDNLLAGRIEIDEKVSLKKNKMEEDVKAVEIQDAKLAELKSLIEADEKICAEQGLAIDEAKKINKQEEDKNREFNQRFAALTAQLSFIEENYDSKTQVKGMSLEVFKTILETNRNVRALFICLRYLG